MNRLLIDLSAPSSPTLRASSAAGGEISYETPIPGGTPLIGAENDKAGLVLNCHKVPNLLCSILWGTRRAIPPGSGRAWLPAAPVLTTTPVDEYGRLSYG